MYRRKKKQIYKNKMYNKIKEKDYSWKKRRKKKKNHTTLSILIAGVGEPDDLSSTAGTCWLLEPAEEE